MLVDSLSIVTSTLLAYGCRLLFSRPIAFDRAWLVWIALFFWAVPLSCGLVLGVFRSAFHTNERYQHLLAWKSYLVSAVIILASLYVSQALGLRGITFLYLSFLPFVFAIGRRGLQRFNTFMRRRGYGIFNALVLGDESQGLDVFHHFSTFPELGYVIKGIVIPNPPKTHRGKLGGSKKTKVYDVKKFSEITERERIDRIFMPSVGYIANGYGEIVKICQEKGIEVKVLSDESEDLLRFSRVRDVAGIPLNSVSRPRLEKAKRMFKKVFDTLLASFLVLIFSPVLLVISVAILIEDGRPIFFTQKRALVDGGEGFDFLKFRSMKKGSEHHRERLYDRNQTTGGLFRVTDDPRITGVGRILRRHSLDELPQLLNVLRGDMSLVGPRPLSIEDLNKIAPENQMGGYYRLRAKSKPGMTGLWQISGRRELSFKEMILLDLYYIENQSLLFDLEIMFATIPVVLFGKGAY
jgi:exopolysaccharide biosynthesis polyprenyl glycosylphosphotransferase